MTKPIRILHVFGKLNRGGAESMIMNLYRTIDRKKIQFDFVKHTEEKNSFEEEILRMGGRIFVLPKFTVTNYFEYTNSWKCFFENHPEYRIIHGHLRSTASLYLKIANKYGLVTIAHSHSTSSGKGISATLKNILQYPIRYTADFLLSCSNDAAKWLYGDDVFNKTNYFLLKNSIEASKFSYNEKKRNKKRIELGIDKQTVVGHVGNFIPVKNHSYLIDIFKEYNKINSNSLLILVGKGHLKEQIIKKIEDYNLSEKVMLLGERSDVDEILQVMDLFLMPSFYEGLPVTLIEAQTAGLPILASDTITDEVKITDLVRFKNIQDEPRSWATEIVNYVDKDRENMYEEIVEAGYDITENAQKLQSFYEKIFLGKSNVGKILL